MEESVFTARVADTALLCDRTGIPRYLGFLTPAEAALADNQLKKQRVAYRFFGGYDGAERLVLACLPEWCESPDFPVCALTFHFRDCDTLNHRDFLGSLMALGITRESVGDILVEPGRAVVFVKDDLETFICSQIDRVGNTGVTLTKGFEQPLPQAGTLVSCSDTVASTRLDCVMGALCNFSRNQATELIEDGKVSVNGICVQKATRTVSPGDVISVRSRGKFKIESTDERSKKGRVVLKYSKFV